MSNTKSILIVLNTDLNIYSVNHLGQEVESIFADSPAGHLNLSDKMEGIWKELSPQIGESDVYFILGPRAGFTDTRMVYMWLRSRELFGLGDFYIHNAKVVLNFVDFGYSELLEYLSPIKQKNSRDLVYSREPRLG